MIRTRSSKWILVVVGAMALALQAVPQEPSRRRHKKGEDTELAHHMEKVEDALKALRRSLRDPDNRDESLSLVSTMETETIACKAFVPFMAATIQEDDRGDFVYDFRRTMLDFLEHQLDLERAILDGDPDAIKEAFGKVHDMEDFGHERFTQDED